MKPESAFTTARRGTFTITDDDWKSFGRWVTKQSQRRAASYGFRHAEREARRSDHALLTQGSADIGKDLSGSVAEAIAALVIHQGFRSDPGPFFRRALGTDRGTGQVTRDLTPAQEEGPVPPRVVAARGMVEWVTFALEAEGDSLMRRAVFGLWCENDGCRRFIRPVAVPMDLSRSSERFCASAVCASCGDPTVLWVADRDVWVRWAPKLRSMDHPTPCSVVYDWVADTRPPRDRPALRVAP